MISTEGVRVFPGRIFFVFFTLTIFFLSYFLGEATSDKTGKDFTARPGHMRKRIILLGASIGRAWDISSWPERMNNQDYVIEYVDGGSFDKSAKLREILSRRDNKPDAVFLKECAAYFPGDLERYKSMMEQWIRECFESGTIPIPSTAIPVTKLHSFKKIMIDIIKLRNPLKFGNPFKHKRNAAILEYNDWIRKYCRDHELACLDLEAAMRYSERNRYLREDFARADGLHINRKAYNILDQIVIPALEKVNWEKKK